MNDKGNVEVPESAILGCSWGAAKEVQELCGVEHLE